MVVSFKNENCFNFLLHLMISLIFYRRPPPLIPVTMAPRSALFPIFELQKFPNTYLGTVTKFQFNSFSRLGAAFKKPEGGGIPPPPPPPPVKCDEFAALEADGKGETKLEFTGSGKESDMVMLVILGWVLLHSLNLKFHPRTFV